MHDPIPRVDWLLRPAGLVRGAACHSAFLISGKLYLLQTGLGWQRLSGAYAVIGNAIVERQIAKNRAFLQRMETWNLAMMVPRLAQFACALEELEQVKVSEYPLANIAEIRIKARAGKPRKIKLVAQDALGNPHQRRAFFSRIPI